MKQFSRRVLFSLFWHRVYIGKTDLAVQSPKPLTIKTSYQLGDLKHILIFSSQLAEVLCCGIVGVAWLCIVHCVMQSAIMIYI